MPASAPEPKKPEVGKTVGGKSRKGAETRARLVDAAKVVFERDGFLEARITDIAKEAGVSHGSYYHYFESKEQLFREVAELQEERLTAPPDDPSTAIGHDAPLSARIEEANRRYLERYRDEARLMGVVEQVSRYDEHVREVRAERFRFFASRSEASIRHWQEDGRVDPAIDPKLAADALGAMVARFAELWLVQEYADYDFDHVVEQLSLLWSNALGLHDAVPTGKKPAKNGKK